MPGDIVPVLFREAISTPIRGLLRCTPLLWGAAPGKSAVHKDKFFYLRLSLNQR